MSPRLSQSLFYDLYVNYRGGEKVDHVLLNFLASDISSSDFFKTKCFPGNNPLKRFSMLITQGQNKLEFVPGKFLPA